MKQNTPISIFFACLLIHCFLMQMLVVFCVGIMIEVVESLILELDAWFLEQLVFDALGIVYLQYWLQANAEVTFPRHLEVLIGFYCNPWPCGQSKGGEFVPIVVAIISTWDLDVQHGFLKMTMKLNSTQTMVEMVPLIVDKVNPIIVNSLIHLWQVINAS